MLERYDGSICQFITKTKLKFQFIFFDLFSGNYSVRLAASQLLYQTIYTNLKKVSCHIQGK